MRVVIILICSLFLESVQAEDRELASDGTSVRLTIKDTYKCSDEAAIKIVTSSAAYFDQDALTFQRLANTARAILGFECSNITKIKFTGFTDETAVFKADAATNKNWNLETEPPPLEWLSLFYALHYQPDFFHLGTFNEDLKPYRKVNGIYDTYQFKAYEKQIKRLVSVIDGDTEKFRFYLKNSGKDFESFEKALTHYAGILKTIKQYVPKHYAAYNNIYTEISSALKKDYWAARVAALVGDDEKTIKQVVSDAIKIAKPSSSPDFTNFVDDYVASWINEEADYIKSDLVDASLNDIRYASEFIDGFPDSSQVDKLSKTKTLIDALSTEMVGLIDQRVAELQVLAIGIIQATGSRYDDTDTIVETGFALAEDFEEAGFAKQGEALLVSTVTHINSVLSSGLQDYKNELNTIELTSESVTTLQEQLLIFDDLSADFQGFSAYKGAVESLLEINQKSICITSLKDAGIRSLHFNKRIYLGDEKITLTDLTCQLNENNHRISEFSWTNWKPGIYTLGIDEEGGKQSRFRFKTDKIFTGQDLHVQARLDDKETQVTEEEWQDYINQLLLPPPNGKPDKNGVRECDKLAADPYDANKLATGIDFEKESSELEEFDFDRAIEACIAAVENDPEDTRQQFQLGRLLWYAGDQETAADYIKLAATANYAPAIYYRAEILLGSSDDPDAFIDALALFKTSGKAGYSRGTAMVKELNPEGINFFKEIPPPTNKNILNASQSGGVGMMGVNVTERTSKVRIKECFQTSATDFSCEYLETRTCSVSSGGGAFGMVLRFVNNFSNACKGSRLKFNSFRKLRNGKWKALPSKLH